MTKKEKVSIILERLDTYYPTETKCYLNYSTDYELLIATMLSAQCTDDRVNIVTKELFSKYPTLESFAEASYIEMENDVRTTGFFRNKAKNIILASRSLLENYDGKVPSDIEELIKLPGVGRKTGNVVRAHIYNLPSVIVDTHVKRISMKLGLTKNTDPVKIEYDLMKILPKEHWIRYNTQIIAHGRKVCKAPNPKCAICFYADICSEYKKMSKQK